MSERVEFMREPEPELETQPAETAPDALRDVIGRVPAEVLETMFFAEAIPADCGHEWLNAAVGARIRFEGSHRGEMRLSVSGAAADSIACAFLGLEPPELTEPLRAQVLLELANILCGAILSHLWPESKVALGRGAILATKTGCVSCCPTFGHG